MGNVKILLASAVTATITRAGLGGTREFVG
jgi:hypothetical protein